MTRMSITIASALALAACGGGGETTGATATATGTTLDDLTPISTEGVEASVLPTAEGKPIVTVRVEGPTAVDPRAEGQTRVGATRYEAIVRMHNEGNDPAEIELAHVDFEAWTEDGQRIACVPVAEQALDTPPLLMPEEMHELRAVAVCHFPEPGEYEVRSYVSFGAEEAGSDWDLARYYAGRTEVRVTSG